MNKFEHGGPEFTKYTFPDVCYFTVTSDSIVYVFVVA